MMGGYLAVTRGLAPDSGMAGVQGREPRALMDPMPEAWEEPPHGAAGACPCAPRHLVEAALEAGLVEVAAREIDPGGRLAAFLGRIGKPSWDEWLARQRDRLATLRSHEEAHGPRSAIVADHPAVRACVAEYLCHPTLPRAVTSSLLAWSLARVGYRRDDPVAWRPAFGRLLLGEKAFSVE